MTLDLKPKELS